MRRAGTGMCFLDSSETQLDCPGVSHRAREVLLRLGGESSLKFTFATRTRSSLEHRAPSLLSSAAPWDSLLPSKGTEPSFRRRVSMIIGFLPPSNWKGANLVTHELHRRKKMQPGNETAFCFPNSSSRIYCRGA